MMKITCMLFAVIVGIARSTPAREFEFHNVSVDDQAVPVEERFQQWMNIHDKTYSSKEETDEKFAVFLENDKFIAQHNAQKLSYTLGHNAFSDMAWEEFRSTYIINGGYDFAAVQKSRNLRSNMMKPVRNGDAPESVDWTTKNAVTPVKNQKQCGGCWAFSTTGSLEGAYAIATGNLLSLSEQDIISCDNIDNGCQGGLMDNAFKWIESNGGVCLEADYPYISGSGITGLCEKSCTNKVTLTGYTDVPSKDEDSLAAAVAQQPVSVAVEADHQVFQLYKSGVLDSPFCGTNLDHGVLIVGYGKGLLGMEYWKVKNSWGPTWGDNGYLKIHRGNNMCGIAMQPSYPTGVKAVNATSNL